MPYVSLYLRKKFVLTYPRVKAIKTSPKPRCEGIRWSEVPLKAVWHPKTHKRQPPEMLEKYRCTRNASFTYRFVDKEKAPGKFCWTHLICRGVEGSMDDHDRWMKFAEKNWMQFLTGKGLEPDET